VVGSRKSLTVFSYVSPVALSLSIHILIVALLLFLEAPYKKPFEYMTVKIVSIVASQPEVSSPPTVILSQNVAKESDIEGKKLTTPIERSPRQLPKEISRKDEIIEEALHAIKAKKRIERIVRLRAEIRGQRSEVRGQKSDVGGQISEDRNQRSDIQYSTANSRYPTQETYVNIVTDIIRSNWTYPEVAGRGLKGSVVILIERNGSVKIQEFNSSGDRLFDYSIRNAILKSTLPPPPEELEIEVRFTQ